MIKLFYSNFIRLSVKRKAEVSPGEYFKNYDGKLSHFSFIFLIKHPVTKSVRTTKMDVFGILWLFYVWSLVSDMHCALFLSLFLSFFFALWMIGARLMRHMYARVCVSVCDCISEYSFLQYTSALYAHKTLKIRIECCLQSHSLCFL